MTTSFQDIKYQLNIKINHAHCLDTNPDLEANYSDIVQFYNKKFSYYRIKLQYRFINIYKLL